MIEIDARPGDCIAMVQRIITGHFEVAGTELCRETVIGDQRYRRMTPQRGPVELTVVP
jgi:hypothetical protein